jgi:hypothetical protein
MKSAGRLPFYLDDRRHTPANQRHRSTAYAHRRYVYLKNGPNRRTTRMIRVPPSGPGGDDEPPLQRRLSSLYGTDNPPIQPLRTSLRRRRYRCGRDCSFAATGAGFTSSSASIRPRLQGRWGIYLPIPWSLANIMMTIAINAWYIARICS